MDKVLLLVVIAASGCITGVRDAISISYPQADNASNQNLSGNFLNASAEPDISETGNVQQPAECNELNCTLWTSCTDGNQTMECSSNCTTQNFTQPCIDHIVFTQVYYDTAGAGNREEWIEIYNPADKSIDVTNWTVLDNAGSWKFPFYLLEGKSYATIAHNATEFQRIYGCAPSLGGFTRGLNDDGDQILLKDGEGTEVDFIAWEGGYKNQYPEWTVRAKEGNALKRNEEDTNSVADWAESAPKHSC